MRNPINHLINVGECNISLFEYAQNFTDDKVSENLMNIYKNL